VKKRKRPERIVFYVTEEEREMIRKKMVQLGTDNMGAYLRKIAIDGYVVNLDLPELRELTALLRRSSNNLNQLTKRVHETARIYDADLESLRTEYDRLLEAADVILSKLALIR
jgi:Bacterial mobilisation protein (MobC).